MQLIAKRLVQAAALLCASALALFALAGSTFAASVPRGAHDNPSMAVALDTQAHTIAAGEAQWYHFDLTGSNGAYVVLSLPGGSHSGLQFQVFASDQIHDWTIEDPTGIGNVEDNGDLDWATQVDMNSDWFVRVINDNPQSATFQFNVTGVDIAGTLPNGTLPSSTIPGTTTPGSTTPSSVTPGTTTPGSTTPRSVTPGANIDPGIAVNLDSAIHAIGAGQSLWYRFELPNTSGTFVTISLPGAAHSGLRFEVYAADQIHDWSSEDPAGRGNVDDNNNLEWSAQSDANSIWYVRVVNDNAVSTNFQFVLTGPVESPGVTIP
jgi:hypothetical protein